MSREAGLLLIAAMGSFVSLSVAARGERQKRLTPAELFRQTSPAIVRVCAYDEQGGQKGQGTGFFVSEDGLLVTNHHVIKDGASWRVLFEDDLSLEVAGVVDTDTRADLAILQVNNQWLPCLELAGDELPSPGERVLAIGNPLGLTNTNNASRIHTELARTLQPIFDIEFCEPPYVCRGSLVRIDCFTQMTVAGENVYRHPDGFVLVGWRQPSEILRIERPHAGQDRQGRGIRAHFDGIRDVHCDATAARVRPFAEGGTEANRADRNAGHGVWRERLCQLIRIDERRSRQLERNRRSSSFRQVGALDQHLAGIDERRLDSRHVRRRWDPG